MDSRYQKQTQVLGFAGEAQAKLQRAKVLIVGAGGLGSPIAAQLCGAGVGEITVMDHDTVELSNLHRQWLFTEAQIGHAKVDALAEHLRRLNSDASINIINQRLAPHNAKPLISANDLVIDAADNFATTYLLNHFCTAQKTALVSASVNQLFGYHGLFCAAGLPSFGAIFPQLPSRATSCESAGVTGPAVAVIAGLQAQAALDWLVGNQSQAGFLHYTDLRIMRMQSIDCRQAPEPKQDNLELITADQIQPTDWVIDVRDNHESKAHPQAFRVDQCLPLQTMRAQSKFSLPQQRIVLSCATGHRAILAAQFLAKHQVTELAAILPGNS